MQRTMGPNPTQLLPIKRHKKTSPLPPKGSAFRSDSDSVRATSKSGDFSFPSFGTCLDSSTILNSTVAVPRFEAGSCLWVSLLQIAGPLTAREGSFFPSPQTRAESISLSDVRLETLHTSDSTASLLPQTWITPLTKSDWASFSSFPSP